MKVITAPMEYFKKEGEVTCFLAGGITNCETWQDDVIRFLRNEPASETEDLVLFNPRRASKPASAKAQIEWEFNALESCDIFSMFFAKGPSVQPICMYELGRNLVRMNEKFPCKKRTIISIEDGYLRKDDVVIQTGLTNIPAVVATGKVVDPIYHAMLIEALYKHIKEEDV